MTSFNEYLSHGNAWLYIPAAIVLGALHGLEPGHSKTMMAAFIVAIRGTVAQAVLLGVAATVSHTALIWVLAFVGLHYSGRFAAEDVEPYLQIATGVTVIALAGWMVWRIRRMQRPTTHGPHGGTVLKTEDGLVELSVFETDVTPRFRLYFFDIARLAMTPPLDVEATCETIRPGGAEQRFQFKSHGTYLEADGELPEPQEFTLQLTLRRAGVTSMLGTKFIEEHHHHHGHEHVHDSNHAHEYAHSHDLQDQDTHEREHERACRSVSPIGT